MTLTQREERKKAKNLHNPRKNTTFAHKNMNIN